MAGECESEELMVVEELEFDPQDLSAVKKIYQREFEVQNEDEGGRCIEKSRKLVREEFYRWDENRMNFVLHETR